MKYIGTTRTSEMRNIWS